MKHERPSAGSMLFATLLPLLAAACNGADARPEEPDPAGLADPGEDAHLGVAEEALNTAACTVNVSPGSLTPSTLVVCRDPTARTLSLPGHFTTTHYGVPVESGDVVAVESTGYSHRYAGVFPGRTFTWRHGHAHPGGGGYDARQAFFDLMVVGVNNLVRQETGKPSKDIYAAVGEPVTLDAIPYPNAWPAGQPVWTSPALLAANGPIASIDTSAPGDFPVAVNCDADGKASTVHVVKLDIRRGDGSALPAIWRLGVASPDHPRIQTARVFVDPWSEVPNVTVTPGTGLTQVGPQIPGPGFITINLVGNSPSVAAGDRHLVAVHKMAPETKVDQRISVVIPSKLGQVPSTSGELVVGVNATLNVGTTPSAAQIPLTHYLLATLYTVPMKIPVSDQFNEPIGAPDLYLGSKIFEVFPIGPPNNGGTVALNVTLGADSTYIDNVGFGINAFGGPAVVVPVGDPLVAFWINNAPLAFDKANSPEEALNIAVQVDQWTLAPNLMRHKSSWPDPTDPTKRIIKVTVP